MTPFEADLLPHPATPSRVGLRVSARAARAPGGVLVLRYVLEARLAELRIPPIVGAPGVRHGLWQHTCFEAFVTLAPGGAYHELNLAPSGEWAAYGFRAYREGTALAAEAFDPKIRTLASGAHLALTATVPLGALSSGYARAPIHVALSAVVEDDRGGIAYLALHHPPGSADFHHAEGFKARLDVPK